MGGGGGDYIGFNYGIFPSYTFRQAAAVPVKKSRLPEEEEEEGEGGASQQQGREDDEDSEEALKKARDFDDFKDGWLVEYDINFSDGN